MSVSALLGNPKPQIFVSGVPAVGYRLFFYAAGTSTKLNTFTDSSGGTPNTNPIVLDAEGYPTGNVLIYGTDNTAYKVILAPFGSDDPPTSPTWTIDNIFTSASGIIQVGTTRVEFNATTGQTLFTLPGGVSYAQGNNSLQVFLGNGSAGGKLLLTKDQDYTETSIISFTLSYGAIAGDKVTAIIGQVLASPATLAASSVIMTSGASVQDALTHTIATNLTITADTVYSTPIQVIQGAIITINNGVKLTFTNDILAGRYQIFNDLNTIDTDYSGGGGIRFSNAVNTPSKVQRIFPEWFGADNSGTDVSTIAFRQIYWACSFTNPGSWDTATGNNPNMNNVMHIDLGMGKFRLDGTVQTCNHVKTTGNWAQIYATDTTTILLETGGWHIYFEGVRFAGGAKHIYFTGNDGFGTYARNSESELIFNNCQWGNADTICIDHDIAPYNTQESLSVEAFSARMVINDFFTHSSPFMIARCDQVILINGRCAVDFSRGDWITATGQMNCNNIVGVPFVSGTGAWFSVNTDFAADFIHLVCDNFRFGAENNGGPVAKLRSGTSVSNRLSLNNCSIYANNKYWLEIYDSFPSLISARNCNGFNGPTWGIFVDSSTVTQAEMSGYAWEQASIYLDIDVETASNRYLDQFIYHSTATTQAYTSVNEYITHLIRHNQNIEIAYPLENLCFAKYDAGQGGWNTATSSGVASGATTSILGYSITPYTATGTTGYIIRVEDWSDGGTTTPTYTAGTYCVSVCIRSTYSGYIGILKGSVEIGKLHFYPSSQFQKLWVPFYHDGSATTFTFNAYNIPNGETIYMGLFQINYGARPSQFYTIGQSGTATQTSLAVYDVDNAQAELVTVGAADSGGAGYKLLRIPN